MTRLTTIALLLAVIVPAFANDSPVPPVIQAKETAYAPKLDGLLDDECWKDASEYTGFLDGTTRKPVDQQTLVKICYDKINIYVAIHALHPEPGKIRAEEKKRNGNIYRDDCVEVDIDSSHSHRGCSAFYVNAIGTQAEYIEGGSATKIQWRGDWRAAAKIVEDGYNVEMAIPFSLLKYNKGQDTFGLCFNRYLPHRQVWCSWPDLNGTGDMKYFADWEGLVSPWTRPKPVFMGYTLGQVGGDNPERVYRGFDLKYPFTNDMLGLVSVKPDFSSIEQDVETVNFSYTERQLPDRRPFFQEWEIDTPSALFYSRRIEDIDVGGRLIGKSGPQIFGFMNARRPGEQNDSLFRYIYQIGERSSVNFGLADHWVPGHRNTVAFYSGNAGWLTGRRSHNIGGGIYSSNTTGSPGGQIKDLHYSTYGSNGSLGGTFYIGRMDPGFNTELGYAPDLNQQGWSLDLSREKSFRNRNLRYTGMYMSLNGWEHLDGTPFRGNFSLSSELGYVNGQNFWAGYSKSHRDQFHDLSHNIGTSWNSDQMYNRGGCGFSWGNTAGGNSNYVWVEQSIKLSSDFTAGLETSRQAIKKPSPHEGIRRQFISTLNYDLTTERSIGGRVVQQQGNRNIYFVYRQQVRLGTDAFLIFGDPNAEKTRSKVSVKLVRPL